MERIRARRVWKRAAGSWLGSASASAARAAPRTATVRFNVQPSYAAIVLNGVPESRRHVVVPLGMCLYPSLRQMTCR